MDLTKLSRRNDYLVIRRIDGGMTTNLYSGMFSENLSVIESKYNNWAGGGGGGGGI